MARKATKAAVPQIDVTEDVVANEPAAPLTEEQEMAKTAMDLWDKFVKQVNNVASRRINNRDVYTDEIQDLFRKAGIPINLTCVVRNLVNQYSDITIPATGTIIVRVYDYEITGGTGGLLTAENIKERLSTRTARGDLDNDIYEYRLVYDLDNATGFPEPDAESTPEQPAGPGTTAAEIMASLEKAKHTIRAWIIDQRVNRARWCGNSDVNRVMESVGLGKIPTLRDWSVDFLLADATHLHVQVKAGTTDDAIAAAREALNQDPELKLRVYIGGGLLSSWKPYASQV